MRKTFLVRNRKDESGQTIAIVALSLFSLFAMAALAIDVASLYSARAEAQKAADAAALAGAKAFVDSGYTTNTATKTIAESMVNAYATAIAAKNNVAGSPPSTVNVSFDDTTYPSNPQVTVQIQQTNLPIFFAKIWGVTLLKAGASATAEAYNPSNYLSSSPSPTSFVGVAPRCIKPLALPNKNPANPGQPFVDRLSGQVIGNSVGQTIPLTSLCQPRRGGRRGPPVVCPINPDNATVPAGSYVPITPESPPSTASHFCPACATSVQPIQQNLECCDLNTYQCGLSSSTAGEAAINYTGYTPFTTSFTLSCATESLGLVDTLTIPSDYPNEPMQISTQNGPTPGIVNTSGSIMTFPIWDTSGTIAASGPGAGEVTIIGFVQAFVDMNTPPPNFTGSFNATILNVVGCGQSSNPAGTPISGGGATPIPVRLIHQ